MLKKLLFGVLTAVFFLAFTACDSRDYSEAVNLLQSGRYEDSEKYLEQIPWKEFHKHIKDSGGVEIVNPDPAYSVVLSAPGEDILVTYHLESRTAGTEAEIEFSAVLKVGNSISDLTAHSKLWLLSASVENQGSAAWNIHDYKKGGGLIWSEYSCSGKNLDAGAKGMCYEAEVQLERLVGGIAQALEESGLGLEMTEIGFANF